MVSFFIIFFVIKLYFEII
jgi:4-hydroxyphenylpyruvate dioxygenase